MSLVISNGSGGGGGGGCAGRVLYDNPSKHHPCTLITPRPFQLRFPLSSTGRSFLRMTTVVSAAKKLSSRAGPFDRKNRRSSTTTTDQKTDQERIAEVRGEDVGGKVENAGVSVDGEYYDDDDFVLPKLPGDEPDFWEGPQWDALGFFVQYMWAFGIVFALIACGIAVVTYNGEATDFKETPAYKESIRSRDLLEEPEESNSDVFESNPTEVAPSLE